VALPSQEDEASNPYFVSAMGGSISELYDIPIGVVNSILYRDALQRATSLNVKQGLNEYYDGVGLRSYHSSM
jgi:hypothetical protein